MAAAAEGKEGVSSEDWMGKWAGRGFEARRSAGKNKRKEVASEY